MYSDFEAFFNTSARDYTGQQWPPYAFNASANPKVLFGHAAVIVGYSNEDFTWTLLNSWGNMSSTVNSKRGVTRDGTFRVKMGVAGGCAVLRACVRVGEGVSGCLGLRVCMQACMLSYRAACPITLFGSHDPKRRSCADRQA